MSFANDEEFAAFVGRDDWLRQVSDEAVSSALAGFPLSLNERHDMAWLAMAVRRALAITMRHKEDGPDRTSNAAIRKELERLAALVGSTWLQLFNCNHAADSQLWRHAWQHWNGDGGTDIGGGIIMGEPSDYRRFQAAITELDWLSSFLRDAAKATESQQGPWRQSEEKFLRIERGQYLAPIFEAAFAQKVSANNWPSGTHKAPSAFMDFYQRMVALAFNEKATPDISGVLKAACQLHRKQPAQFAEGIIPGL